MTAWDVATRKRYDLTLEACDYPAWPGRPARTILLCSEPRSGSTLLGEALYFAGGLGCPLEYFHVGFRPDFEARWQTRDAASYLDAVHRHRTAPNGTFSTKLFWRDIVELLEERDAAFGDTMREIAPEDATPAQYRRIAATLGPLFADATIVHLRRVDRVRGAVSVDLAAQTGLWRAIPGVGEHTPLAEPAFDFDRIAARIAATARAHAHWVNLFAAIHVHVHTLTYEALTRTYHGTVARLLAALGASTDIAEPRMQRQSDQRSEAFTLRYLREAQRRLDTIAPGDPAPGP